MKGVSLKTSSVIPRHRKEPLFSTSYSLEQSWPIFLTLIWYISATASRNWQRVVNIYLYYIYCKMLIQSIAVGVPDTGIVSFSFISWRMWYVKLSALAFNLSTHLVPFASLVKGGTALWPVGRNACGLLCEVEAGILKLSGWLLLQNYELTVSEEWTVFATKASLQLAGFWCYKEYPS